MEISIDGDRITIGGALVANDFTISRELISLNWRFRIPEFRADDGFGAVKKNIVNFDGCALVRVDGRLLIL